MPTLSDMASDGFAVLDARIDQTHLWGFDG